jgi:hypothetical protein
MLTEQRVVGAAEPKVARTRPRCVSNQRILLYIYLTIQFYYESIFFCWFQMEPLGIIELNRFMATHDTYILKLRILAW